MGVKLTIEAETPLSADDRDILAGLSAFVYAVANRDDLADQAQVQDGEEGEPLPCGAQPEHEPTRFCIREPGHSGRHTYRPLNGLVN